MRSKNEMSIWHNVREILTWYVIRLFLAALLFAALMTAFSMWMWPSSEEPLGPTPKTTACIEPIRIEEIRKLAMNALNDAFSERVRHLFEIWMRDETGQPQRASTGIQQAIRAYDRSHDLVIGWSPNPCTTIGVPGQPPEERQ